MIYLFHGENQPALREALLELKGSYDNAFFWEGELDELRASLLSPSLLCKKELVVIESPQTTDLKKIIVSAEGGAKDLALVFADKVPVGKLPKGKDVQTFYFRSDIPKNVFPFLDALLAKDRKRAFTTAHQLLRGGEDVHFLLTMIVWQLRSLARVKGKETKGIHPYALSKLKRLEENFTEEEISQAFSLLLKEDLKIKKGRSHSAALDFLIDKLTG
jgi:DNA polymerase III delta subunit